MSRNQPITRADPQRSALSEFLAGHISAGQLSDRIQRQKTSSPGPRAPGPHQQRPMRRTAALAVLAALGGGALAVAVEAGGTPQPGTAAAHRPPVAGRMPGHRARHRPLVTTQPATNSMPQPAPARSPARKPKPAARQPAAPGAPKRHSASASTAGFSVSGGHTFTVPSTTTSGAGTAPSTTTPGTTTTAAPTGTTTTATTGTTTTG